MWLENFLRFTHCGNFANQNLFVLKHLMAR